jgi:proline iminopeptidase
MGHNEGYIQTDDGLRLYYRQAGTGADVVIVPGACWCAADLAVLAHQRTLLFYDQRGRGASDSDAGGVEWWTEYEPRDLDAVRRHFGLERLALIGWSYLGGVVILYTLAHPERVQRLVLMSAIAPRSPAPYDDPAARQQKAEARLDPGAVQRLEAARQAGRDHTDPIGYCREELQVYRPQQLGKREALAHMRSDPCIYPNEWPDQRAEHQRKHFPAESWERDWRAAVSSINVPTLVIHGTEDLISVAAAREWATSLPNARLLLLPEVGHFPHLEAPELFFPAVEQFLGGVWPAAAEQV